MKINSSIHYTIVQFINEFLNEYHVFTGINLEKFYENSTGEFYSDDEEVIEITKFKLPFTMFMGCSKLCLVFNKSNVVVKIPIYSYNNDSGDYKKAIMRKIKDGRYADSIPNIELDSCLKEVRIYNEAKVSGLENFFAEEQLLFTYRGIRIYGQEKIDEIYEFSEKKHRETNENVRKSIMEVLHNLKYDFGKTGYDMLDYIDLTDCFNFIENLYQYDCDVFLKLINFIVKKGINDLHAGNIGYDINGGSKIIDYSGYEGGTTPEL